MDPLTPKPMLRAIIARKLPHGGMGRSRVVGLATAYLALHSGSFVVVGPDPEDEENLAHWARVQPAPRMP